MPGCLIQLEPRTQLFSPMPRGSAWSDGSTVDSGRAGRARRCRSRWCAASRGRRPRACFRCATRRTRRSRWSAISRSWTTSRGEALAEALLEAGFVLEVVEVLEIEEDVEIRRWKVRTRQGLRSFQTALDAWPRDAPTGGLLIEDVAGDLFRIPPQEDLDAKSRKRVWAFLD